MTWCQDCRTLQGENCLHCANSLCSLESLYWRGKHLSKQKISCACLFCSSSQYPEGRFLSMIVLAGPVSPDWCHWCEQTLLMWLIVLWQRMDEGACSSETCKKKISQSLSVCLHGSVLFQWGKEVEIGLYSMVTEETTLLWVNSVLGLVVFVTTGECWAWCSLVSGTKNLAERLPRHLYNNQCTSVVRDYSTNHGST